MDASQIHQIQSETQVAAIEFHQSIPSTNDRGLELAASGWKYPGLVLASQQTSGRGRGNHRWWSSEDSLTFSWLVPLPISHQIFLSVVAPLAIIETLDHFSGHPWASIKWPNDILLNGRRLRAS